LPCAPFYLQFHHHCLPFYTDCETVLYHECTNAPASIPLASGVTDDYIRPSTINLQAQPDVINQPLPSRESEGGRGGGNDDHPMHSLTIVSRDSETPGMTSRSV